MCNRNKIVYGKVKIGNGCRLGKRQESNNRSLNKSKKTTDTDTGAQENKLKVRSRFKPRAESNHNKTRSIKQKIYLELQIDK